LIAYCSRSQVTYRSYGIVFVINSSQRLFMLSISLLATGDLLACGGLKGMESWLATHWKISSMANPFDLRKR